MIDAIPEFFFWSLPNNTQLFLPVSPSAHSPTHNSTSEPSGAQIRAHIQLRVLVLSSEVACEPDLSSQHNSQDSAGMLRQKHSHLWDSVVGRQETSNYGSHLDCKKGDQPRDQANTQRRARENCGEVERPDRAIPEAVLPLTPSNLFQ